MGTEYVAVAFTILFTIATSALLGGYMYRVFTGQRTWLDPVFVPIETLVLRLIGVDPNEQQDWKRYSVSLLVSNVVMWLATWTIVTLQQYLPLNPDGIGNHGADARVQHDLELRHQHEPAALQRRDRPVLSLADVRHHVSAVRDRGDRRGRGGRHHSRPGRQPAAAARQLLRRPDARHRPALPAAGAAGVGPRDVAGHAADVRACRHGHDGRGRGADDRPRRHGRRRVDQAARHQRRRLLRSELGASRTRTRRRSRTSSRPGRSRSFRWRWSSMLGHFTRRRKLARRHLRDDAGDLPADGGLRRRAGGGRQSRHRARWASISPPGRWRARRSASAPASRRCGR